MREPPMREPPAEGPGVVRLAVATVTAGLARAGDDALAVEEPLELRLAHHGAAGLGLVEQSVSVTMRTPGHDLELACGFLVAEGLIGARADVAGVRHCGPAAANGMRNVVRVELSPAAAVDVRRLARHFYTSSSCGVCGKTSLEALHVAGMQPLAGGLVVAASVLHGLPATLRAAQPVFGQTGGLHAAGLFDAAGGLRALREDVGRHNAVDKVVGAELLAGRLPLRNSLLLVSGRASFELVQKAVLAGIPVMAAVGAPSSLAVELARRYGLTLVGFLRHERFNIYAGAERITGLAALGPERGVRPAARAAPAPAGPEPG